MATTSSIAVQHANGTVSQVHCHWDGYLSHVGQLLDRHYNTQEKAEALVALGDISSLDRSMEKPEGHTFIHPVDGYTVFYGRDRGEKGTEPKQFKSYTNFLQNFDGEEYNYLFIKDTWFVEDDGDWISVKEALAREAAEDAE